MAVVMILCPDWESNDGCEDQDEVHDHEDCLQLAHDLRHYRGEDPMAKNASEESAVNVSVGRRPVSITGDNNDG